MKSATNLKETAVRNEDDFMRQGKYSRKYESDLFLLKKSSYYIFKE